MLFLGQAVASASDGGDASVGGSNNASSGVSADYNAESSNSNESTTTGGSTGSGGGGGGGGGATTDVDQDSTARNDVSNEARSGNTTATGGTSYVLVVAGNGNQLDAASNGKGDVAATQTVHNEVGVASSGGSASVSGSNNASAGNGAHHNAESANSNESTTTGGAGGGHGDGGDADTDVDQDSTARNDVDNDARSGNTTATGGDSLVGVFAGNDNELDAASDGKKHDDGDVEASQTIHNEVDVASRGGHAGVLNSNNASAGNGAHYDAESANHNDSATRGGSGGRHGDGGDADLDVDQDSRSRNDVDNDARTGNVRAEGGDSIIKVIVGNDNTLTCTSETGDVDCEQHITNIVNIISIAGGADVVCSNNASAGGHGWSCYPAPAKPVHQPAAKPVAQPVHQAAPAPVHAVKAAPAAYRAPAQKSNTMSQPAGQLAYTGSDVSAPLALGLLALGLGAALTLAGRRRSTATV